MPGTDPALRGSGAWSRASVGGASTCTGAAGGRLGAGSKTEGTGTLRWGDGGKVGRFFLTGQELPCFGSLKGEEETAARCLIWRNI